MESRIYSEKDLEEAQHPLIFHIQRKSIANELDRKLEPREHIGTDVVFGELIDGARMKNFVDRFVDKA